MRRFMLGSAVVLLAPTVLPGWALASVLDGSGDRLRKGLLAPALGLLLLYGLNGALLLLGIWSSAVVWVSILAMNIVAYRLINIRHEVLAKRSRWQLLGAAMRGELSEETDTPSLSKEAEVQLLFRERRSMPLFALGIAIATTALLTPMIQHLPFGVDWIGFAMLTQQMMVEGQLALSKERTRGSGPTLLPFLRLQVGWVRQPVCMPVLPCFIRTLHPVCPAFGHDGSVGPPRCRRSRHAPWVSASLVRQNLRFWIPKRCESTCIVVGWCCCPVEQRQAHPSPSAWRWFRSP